MDTKLFSSSMQYSVGAPAEKRSGNFLTAALRRINPLSNMASASNSGDRSGNLPVARMRANANAFNRGCSGPNIFGYTVTVSRGRNGKQVFEDTGRVQYVTGDVAAGAPLVQGNEEEIEYIFFKAPAHHLADSDVETERAKLGLVRDLEAQAQLNAEYPEFADDHRNGDSWQDSNGNWCCVLFASDGVRRFVLVERSDRGWGEFLWFGGRVP